MKIETINANLAQLYIRCGFPVPLRLLPNDPLARYESRKIGIPVKDSTDLENRGAEFLKQKEGVKGALLSMPVNPQKLER